MAYEMGEKERQRMIKYFTGGAVVCDECGAEIDINKSLWDRVIAKDPEGYDVIEKYFTCPNCKKHYTASVIDRQQLLNIRDRLQVRKIIQLHRKIRSRAETIQKYQKQEEALKEKQMQRSEILKAKYRKECESGMA